MKLGFAASGQESSEAPGRICFNAQLRKDRPNLPVGVGEKKCMDYAKQTIAG